MDFIAIKDGKPLCRLSGISDVIHFNGIGGYGENWGQKPGGVPKLIPPVGWNIDCLPASGLLQIFVHRHDIKCGRGLSSFEIYAIPRKKNNA
jgi:hypothetical protein